MKRVLKTIRTFVITDLLGNEISFDNVYDAANYLDVSVPTIYNSSRNKKMIKSNEMLFKIEYNKKYE